MDVIQHVADELRAPESLSCVLVRAERALVRLLGIRSARELPISFQELLYAQEDLRDLVNSLTVQSKDLDSNFAVKMDRCDVFDGQQLSQHCVEIMRQDLLDCKCVETDEFSNLLHQLLLCLSNAESSLCQAYEVGGFAEFALPEKRFVEFLARYGQLFAEHLAAIVQPTMSKLPTVTKVLKLLNGAPERVSQHFVGLSVECHTAELANICHSEEISAVCPACPPRELQVFLANSFWAEKKEPRPLPHGCSTSEERRAALTRKAAHAISQVPVLIDLIEALPEWKRTFEPSLGTLFQFLDDLGTSSAFSGRLPPLAVIEVRCGLLMRLTDGAFNTLEAALVAKDPRTTAATVMSRLLTDGQHAPMLLSCKKIVNSLLVSITSCMSMLRGNNLKLPFVGGLDSSMRPVS